MKIFSDVDLKPFNTFGLSARAAFFTELDDAAQLPEICRLQVFDRQTVLWLGGGSNVLFDGDYGGLVVKMNNRGIREIRRENGNVWVEAQAGEVWHDFVLHTVAQGWNGLENLSLIPGTVGASPVQNIGAYGVEVKERIESVRCFDLERGTFVELGNADCRFAYRESLFKQEGKGRYVICSVVFRLSEQFELKAGYGDLAAVLAEQCVGREPSAADVSEAVCTLRRSKLPDPNEWGNVGSFFKNPAVSSEQAAALQAQYETMPCYPQSDGSVKLAAGWLIDQCRLKNFQIGGAAVHDKQALVLVNKGSAAAGDVRALQRHIQAAVAERFGIELETEPNWLCMN
ncbi:MAG: UDP-N-acetylmuramate dehydrogenase [Neisseria sp.]|nr:UDP-N-acetylmuramate dehydrogenase [Neisseria sp.]